MVVGALEGLASVIVAEGVAQLAVQCLAAASALRARMGAPMRPADESGDTALIVEVDEGSTEPTDRIVSQYGGRIYRSELA
jgi:hypothetical protein